MSSCVGQLLKSAGLGSSVCVWSSFECLLTQLPLFTVSTAAVALCCSKRTWISWWRNEAVHWRSALTSVLLNSEWNSRFLFSLAQLTCQSLHQCQYCCTF